VSYTLPSPTDTPYRTPSSSRSGRSRPYGSMSPSSSTPPLPSEDRSTKRRSNDSINTALDENISPLDPRRFTPTLHASLVSEILSLRRDLESKTKDIDHLENNLHSAQRENDKLNENLVSSNKETRSLKRQMQLLESSTLTALDDIAKERDEALSDLTDLRRRLDQSQKRAKSHEDNAERTQSLLEREREGWGAEKRALETKVNIVEGRLKAVLNEVANSQFTSNHVQISDQLRQQRGAFPESPVKRSTSALSHRRYSGASNNSDHFGGRVSALGNMNGISTSLADELALEEEDEDQDDADDGRISPDALPEERERPTSRLSVKAHKILGINLGVDESDAMDSPERHRSFGIFTGLNQHPPSAPQVTTVRHIYTDAAVQHSPPATPTVLPSLAISSILKTEVLPSEFSEPRASSPERISLASLVGSVDSCDAPWKADHAKFASMISTSCQTIELLPSPPLTPVLVQSGFSAGQDNTPDKIEMMSVSTQTDDQAFSDRSRMVYDVRKLPIPTIAIIPPSSRPATPETAVVLPPHTKSAGCQVNMQSYAGYRSSGMQTEEIKIDRRPIDLPRIHPSSIMSQYKPPSSKTVPSNSSRRRFPQTTPPLLMYDPKQKPIAEPFYPPNNDSGPLVKDFASNVNRPVRSSSLFAGFDENKDEHFGRFDDDAFDEDDIFNRPIAKFTVRSGKLVSQEPGLEDIGEVAAVSAGEAVALENLRLSEDGLPPEIRNNLPGRKSPRKKSVDSGSRSYKQIRRVPSPKRNNIRRVTLISTAHSTQPSIRSSQDSATPTEGNVAPFPVPIRFSSARLGKSMSEGGRSSPASSGASPTKRDKQHRNRKPLLRKVRSGPAVSPGPNGRRPRSRSPPNPRVSIIPDIPSFQMPVENASIRRYQPSEASAPRPSIATGPNRTSSHAKTNSDAVSLQQTSVVDAIAQTMVGEWMFKYVRRKSFGMPESKPTDYDPTKNADDISATVTSTGVRHKRWVWLAPYERAVMWSSKQPTSNTALLGKSGRKCKFEAERDSQDADCNSDHPICTRCQRR
jgi:Meiotic cell cortex C-terminal pleckstrin homology